MKKKEFNLGKDALIMAIMTFLTVVTWIVVEAYSTLKKTTIPEVTRQQMQSLDPKINQQVFDNLKKRIWFEKKDLFYFASLKSSLVDNLATESAEASGSVEIIEEVVSSGEER